MSVNIRFILTGACHPYSGRQVLFAVPLQQGSNPTTIADVKAICRRCWPPELPAIKDDMPQLNLKILKSGKLFDDAATLKTILTQAEIDESSTDAQTSGTGFDDTTQNTARTVLMHLVFQKPLPPSVAVPPAAEPTKDPKRAAPETDSGCGCVCM